MEVRVVDCGERSFKVESDAVSPSGGGQVHEETGSDDWMARRLGREIRGSDDVGVVDYWEATMNWAQNSVSTVLRNAASGGEPAVRKGFSVVWLQPSRHIQSLQSLDTQVTTLVFETSSFQCGSVFWFFGTVQSSRNVLMGFNSLRSLGLAPDNANSKTHAHCEFR